MKDLKTLTRWMWVAVLAVCLVPSLASAQDKASPAEKRAQIEARMAQVRAKVLRESVGLNDAKAKQVEGVLQKRHAQRQALSRETIKHRRAIGKLIKKDSNDQDAYRRSIEALRNVRDRMHALNNAEFDELRAILTPKQQALLAVASKQIQRQLRQALRKGAKKRQKK